MGDCFMFGICVGLVLVDAYRLFRDDIPCNVFIFVYVLYIVLGVGERFIQKLVTCLG